ncbi:hypothetical protein OSTOST_03954 [Ostertagia ostertagi]
MFYSLCLWFLSKFFNISDVRPFHNPEEFTANHRNAITSAAGLIVVDKSKHHSAFIAATASGSLRTVEAVASAVLRMLLFDEEPGAAINANATFHDFVRGGFYCENQDEKFLEAIQNYANMTSCLPVDTSNVAHVDRVAMAVRRRLPDGRLVGAVDGRAVDFNYAAGF